MPIHRLYELGQHEWVFIVRGSQGSQECGILIACRSWVTYIGHEGNKQEVRVDVSRTIQENARPAWLDDSRR